MLRRSEWSCLQGAPLVKWGKHSIPIMSLTRSPSMIHPTPTKVLLATTFEPLVMQLSGLLARGTRLLDRFVHAEPTPETTIAFEHELSDLLREVGRRIMAWTLNRLEPDADSEAPSRVLFEGVSLAATANIRMSWACDGQGKMDTQLSDL